MPIFPSGKRRIMEAQLSNENTQTGIDVGDEAAKSFRAQPQQEEIVDEGGQMAAVPAGGNSQNAASPMEGNADPSQANIDSGASQDVVPSDEKDGTSQESDIKNAVFSMLTELGVPPRQLKESAEKIIEITHDLSSGNVTGFYLIPTFTQGHAINESHAKQLASNIGKKFNLTQKLKSGGLNYRIDFQTNNDQLDMGHGTSFDQLGGKGQGSFGGARKAASVAPSMSEMISHSKNLLYSALKKSEGEN